MSEYGLLILPILGAYFFLSYTYILKFRLRQLGDQQLIFETFLFALILIIPSYLLGFCIKKYCPEMSYWILSNLPIKIKWIGTCSLTVLIGIIGSIVTNKIWPEFKSIQYVVKNYGNGIDQLLLKTFYETNLLMVTLNNGKIYVGFVPQYPPHWINLSYFDMVPIMSGYRKNETHEVIITTDYLEAYDDFTENEEDSAHIEMLIKTNEIITASPFNIELAEKFQIKPTKKEQK